MKYLRLLPGMSTFYAFAAQFVLEEDFICNSKNFWIRKGGRIKDDFFAMFESTKWANEKVELPSEMRSFFNG